MLKKKEEIYLNQQRDGAHQIYHKPWILRQFLVTHLVAHLLAHLLAHLIAHLSRPFSIVSSCQRALNNKYNRFVAEQFKSTADQNPVEWILYKNARTSRSIFNINIFKLHFCLQPMGIAENFVNLVNQLNPVRNVQNQ